MEREYARNENEFDTYDIFADLYDSVHAGVTNDIPFYVEEACRSALPVLEVGCGTGRVLIPVAAAGIPVVGIDISQRMLAKCQDKVATLPSETRSRITLLHADVRDVTLSQRFGLIYLPNRTFNKLLRMDDQIQALRNIWHHLQDGGRLALNFFDPNLNEISLGLGEMRGILRAPGKELMRLDNGNSVSHIFTSTYQPTTQCVDHTIIIEEINMDGRVIDRHYVHHLLRWVYRYEFEHLLSRCGFELEALYGTFDRQPYARMGQELIWVAKKVTG
jgi:SAM-dependent methyltransferase